MLVCNQHACSFWQWERFSRMRQDDCPHCGQALRASLRTWIVMVLSIVLFVALL